jgi:pimeloyl-ACP methyl ester carboxylesterase
VHLGMAACGTASYSSATVSGSRFLGVTTDQRVEAFLKSADAVWFNTILLKAYEKGGHFVPFENPEAIIADIRETFQMLR